MQLTVYSLGVNQIASYAYLQDGTGISDNFLVTAYVIRKSERQNC